MHALPDWRRVDFISDLHLQAAHARTAQALQRYLADAPFDALFILGDLFEVWVGDDALDNPAHPEHALIANCVQALHSAARRAKLFFMHGNRDFLIGPGFAQASGCTLIDDPCVLDWSGQRWLLSHGDAWCLADTQYQRFRQTARQPAWQADFLAQPLPQRWAQVAEMRQKSEQHKQTLAHQADAGFADVDTALAQHWLAQTQTSGLIHGHTHQPGEHDMGAGRVRVVLSDWDASAKPARLEVLSLHADGSRLRQTLSAA